MTEIVDAIMNNDIHEVDILLSQPYDIDNDTQEKSLALIAAEIDNLDILKLILEYDISFINSPDITSAISVAIYNNNVDMVEYLMYKGAYPDADNLQYAVIRGNKYIVNILLMYGADKTKVVFPDATSNEIKVLF